MLGLQILIDGFAISTLYGLAALGFTLIFGVSGVLNLSHGGIMIVAGVTAWACGNYGFGPAPSLLFGVVGGLVLAMLTYGLVVRPIQRSRAIPAVEKEIFILTGTLLWGIMIQEAVSYLFTDNPITVRPLLPGVISLLGVRTPANELFIAAVSWLAIILLWLLVNRTPAGKRLLAASINPRGLTLLGWELSHVYVLAWVIYGVLAGIAGVLLATFLGASSGQVGSLTASAFSIVVLGGLGSVTGSLIAAYVVGYIETLTAYLISPQLRSIPVLLLLVLVVYLRPQGLLGRR